MPLPVFALLEAKIEPTEDRGLLSDDGDFLITSLKRNSENAEEDALRPPPEKRRRGPAGKCRRQAAVDGAAGHGEAHVDTDDTWNLGAPGADGPHHTPSRSGTSVQGGTHDNCPTEDDGMAQTASVQTAEAVTATPSRDGGHDSHLHMQSRGKQSVSFLAI